jgi:fructosamine-3-kinase
MNTLRHPRQDIYYWKCDRPAAFHGLRDRAGSVPLPELEGHLANALSEHFGGQPIRLRPGGGQGNHHTFIAMINGREAFVRVEAGPEGDDYMEIEAHILQGIAKLGVPAPGVLGVNATRRQTPFAWQVLTYVPQPDLNRHFKDGRLNVHDVMFAMGANIARWQAITPLGYGPFDIAALRETHELRGYHPAYTDYFHLRLATHLDFLTRQGFLSSGQAGDVLRAIERHTPLLKLESACLVHKDLALWNVLGTPDRIAAFIDWDDAVGGDPTDDLSLLGCFHDGNAITRVLDGYASVRPLPTGYRRRFWLHLLRNMLFKAVIRVGAGYFERDAGFFLIGAGTSGAGLKRFTLERIALALRGLEDNADPSIL